MLENEREKICIYVRTTLVHWVHTYYFWTKNEMLILLNEFLQIFFIHKMHKNRENVLSVENTTQIFAKKYYSHSKCVNSV